MIDSAKRQQEDAAKQRIYSRVRNTSIDLENYECIPAKEPVDYTDNYKAQRVAVYARVSTDSVQQTSSYELQKKYYEEFVAFHPLWTLVKIYADEGISGTSLKHRDSFRELIADCRTGKIDLIITKSVSRFARNVVDFLSTVQELAQLPHPVCVFFESEHFFSLKDDTQMALTFQATMAQEESHIKSRSMETSLHMRLDGGLPLTPKLLGYSHDSDGQLIINHDEAPTVKLIFYMYLYGYSTAEIAETLTAMGKKTYLGNVTWTAGSIVQVLRNERHCGDVRTRKTFTPDYLTHLSKKNRGDRMQSIYYGRHEAIVSRDDFIAVQHLLDNAKYGNKSILPELRVIDSGILKGFVSISPRWAGFKEVDYYQAAASIQTEEETETTSTSDVTPAELQIAVAAGDFDLRGFEITRSEFFDSTSRPYMIVQDKKIKLSTSCVRKFGKHNQVELFVNPIEKKFAVRSAPKDSRNAVVCSKVSNGVYYAKDIPCAAFYETLYKLFDWNTDFKYRITGTVFQKGEELVYVFDTNDAEAFIKSYMLTDSAGEDVSKASVRPLSVSGKHIRAVPQEWTGSFGNQYYLHQKNFPPVATQSEADWKIRMEGRLFETGKKIHVTAFSELKSYIEQELSGGPVAAEDYVNE